MLKYKIWMESRELYDQAKTSIIGVLPDELKGSSEDEEQLLQMSTKDLSTEVLDKIKNLGIISNIKNDNPQKWQDVMDSIKNGAIIKDLISKVAGLDGLGHTSPTLQPNMVPNSNSLF